MIPAATCCDAGVIEGGDMLPEVALVKTDVGAWRTRTTRKKAAALMQRDLKGECMQEERPWIIRHLGLIAGIEIHQQLDTQEKLFCHCPTTLREIPEHNGEFFRYLRATESEMGEIDRAAQEEMKHDRKFQYYTYDTTCLGRER